MAVSIRLARLGCRHRPFYRVVVTDSRAPRDGKNIEVVGYYNPVASKDDEKRVSLKLERVKYWLSVGAQPSETVESLLFRAGLVTPSAMKRQGGQSDNPVDGNNNEVDGISPEAVDGNNSEVDGISPEAVFSIGLPVN